MLSFLFLVLSIILMGHFIGSVKELRDYREVSIVCHQFIYLVGLFYFYVHANIGNGPLISGKSYVLHFLPFLIMQITVTLVLIYADIWYYYFTLSFVSNGLLCLYFPAYLLMINHQLKRANISFSDLFSFSSIRKHNRYFWICSIGLGFALLSILKIGTFFSWNLVRAGQLCLHLSMLTLIGFFVLITATIYLGLGHSSLFLTKSKYSDSQIHAVDRSRLLKKILDYFERDRPFLDSEFNLNRLSAELNMPSRYISQLLNQEYGCSFRKLVNKYRIEEAKLLIDKNGEHNLYQIALDAGYNSKSTFNAAFKKYTGITPKEYKKRTK